MGLSREALAEQVDYSIAMLRTIEDDEHRPSEKAVALLARALAITPEQMDGFLKIARPDSAIDHLDRPVEYGPNPKATRPSQPRVGETERAENFLRQSVSRSREVCDLTLMATTLTNFGVVTAAARRVFTSKQYFLEPLKMARKTKSFSIAMQALLGVASMHMGDGNAESALELATYIVNHASSLQDLMDRAEQLRSELLSIEKIMSQFSLKIAYNIGRF